MNKYTHEHKSEIVERLIANRGDVVKTSAETGVPERTLWRWRKEIPPLPLPPLPPIEDSKEGFREGLPPDDLQALRNLKTRMLELADYIITYDKIKEAIDSAPLNQRIGALTQLTDRIIKLAAELPTEEEEIIVYEGENAYEEENAAAQASSETS